MLFGPELIPVFALLFALHQVGHLVSARLMGLPVPKVKLSSQPLPHPYAIAFRTTDRKKQLVYILSGVGVSVSLFVVGALFGFFQIKTVYYALVLIVLLDSNPFYSDTLLAMSLLWQKRKFVPRGKNWKQQYQQQFGNQLYSVQWYMYFIIWAVSAIVLLSPQMLPGILFTN
jgi:hypothetical protein